MTEVAEHTPGPWKVLKVGNQWGIVKAKAARGDDDICGGSQFHDDWQANARLIAAAPDLLSSHGRLLANFRLLLAGKPVRDVAEMYAEAEAAIAKATGT